MNSRNNSTDSRVRRVVGARGRWRAAVVLGGALASLVAASAAHAGPSSAPDAGAYTTNGPVTAIAHAAGRTYVGGLFTRVGRRSGSGVALSPLGAPQSFPEVAGGDVRAVVSDGAEGWYIGGDFTAVGGQPRIALAHVNSDGSLDPSFTPVATDFEGDPAAVNVLELSPPAADGTRTLYVGGEFSLIGVGDVGDLEFHTNIAALNAADGQVITAFGPTADCPLFMNKPCPVNALELVHVPLPVTVDGNTSDQDQPLLFVGGSFTKLGPSDAPKDVTGVGAVWGATSVDADNVGNAGAIVRITTAADGTYTVWKPSFFSVSGSAHTLQAGPWKDPRAAQPALALYVGGHQGTQGAKAPIAKALQFKISNRTTRAASFEAEFFNWKPNPGGCNDCAVRAMALDGSQLRFGGDFTTPAAHLATIASIPDPTVTAFNATATAFGPSLDGPVRSLALSAPDPTTLFAGGGFDQRIVALDSTSGTPSTSWTSPAPDAPVHALATSASTSSIYAGGEFRSLGSQKRTGLAAFDAAGALLDWSPDVTADDSLPLVHALAASDRTVYVGGQFDALSGDARANLVGVDATSDGSVQALPEASSTSGEGAVLSLALLGSTLYVGGAFDHVGGQLRDNLAAVDVATNSLLGWGNPGARGNDAVVYSVLPACGAVYVGGWFQELGGQPRQNLAAVDPSTGAANGWHPRPDGTVLALARSGRTIYAGGDFTKVTGGARQKVAGLDAGDGTPTAFNAGIDAVSIGASVQALAVSDSAVYLGGIFTSLRGESRSNLAAVNPATGEPTGWDPSASGPVEALAVGDDTVHAGGSFRSLGATAQSGLARFGSGAGSPFTSAACSSPSTSAESGSESSSNSPDPQLPSTNAGETTPRADTGSASPEIGRVSVTPTRLRVGRRPLAVRFRLSRGMSVRLRFQRRVRTLCPARSTRAVRRHPCVRYVRFADVTARGKPGLNRVSFPGQRVGRRRLVPGTYRIELVGMPPARAAARRLAYFKVLRR
jgi:beta-propeller uncharacterized protein DUF5122